MREKEKMVFVALLTVLKNSKQSKCLTIDLLNGITVRWGTIQLFKVVMIYICSYLSFIDVYSLYVLNCVIASGNKQIAKQ